MFTVGRVRNGPISAARTQCKRHCSGGVVAETLNIHWCHIEGRCNNSKGMSLKHLSFFIQSWVCQYTREFYRWNAAESWHFDNFGHIINAATVWIKQDTKVPGFSHIWWNGWITNIGNNVFLAAGSFTDGNDENFCLVISFWQVVCHPYFDVLDVDLNLAVYINTESPELNI